jgi:predicted enzyme related to lactoylglutathione lyase
MKPPWSNDVMHVELHTHDRGEALVFLTQLLGWHSERVGTDAGSYLALGVGDRVGGGIVECGLRPARWLPYVGVGDVAAATERASGLGASVLLDPREGPAGWRSVVSTPACGDLALWEPKGRRRR